MNKFTKFMLGVWIIPVTLLVMALTNDTWPEIATESANWYGAFFILSVLTATGIWMSE